MTASVLAGQHGNPPFVRSHSPIRIDWASLQSSSGGDSIYAHSIDRDAFRTPPPRASTTSHSRDESKSSEVSTAEACNAHRSYDIPTLMQYRGSLAGLTVFAKIGPEALSENLFPFLGAQRPCNPVARIRALSELSNRSRYSLAPSTSAPLDPTNGPNGNTNGKKLAPPDILIPQRHDGFVRFLKQHASPPHHRVTAGGRIVPTGPHSPPPMFDYESLTGMVDRRRHKLQDNYYPRIPANDARDNVRSPNWPMLQSAPFDDQARLLNGYQQTPASLQSVQTSFMPPGSMAFPQFPSTASPMTPASFAPVGSFEDGSMMAVYNGNYYRAYWNGISTVVEPLPVTMGPAPLAFQHGNQTQPVHNQARSKPPSSSQTSKQIKPLADSTNQSRVSSSHSQISRSAQQLDARERDLKADLHKLDRHLALHHYELSQQQRASFVAQRRSLIEDIDDIRKIREPASPDRPFIKVKDLAKRATERASKSRSGQQSSLIRRDTGPVSARKVSGLSISKTLSPNAPPFVPSNSRITQFKAPVATAQARSQPIKISHPDSGQRMMIQDKEIVLHKQESSLDRDPEDPAMRIVHNSDIAYAAEFEDQTLHGKKQYCTTVSEFQEALRRVRQHARQHGCAGGSSKDPAYDAEQDIWWAICDKDPIPLPTGTPDHVKNPRPWDWGNSVFNYRYMISTQWETTLNLNIVPPNRTLVQNDRRTADHKTLVNKTEEAKNDPFRSSLDGKTRRASQQRVASMPSRLDREIASVERSSKTFGPLQAKVKTPRVDVENSQERANKGTPLKGGSASTQVETQESTSAVNQHSSTGQSRTTAAENAKSSKPTEQTQTVTSALLTPFPSLSGLKIQGIEESEATSTKFSRQSRSSVEVPSQESQIEDRLTTTRERHKGPRKMKSKQQMKSSTSLRRHRQSLKHVKSDKQIRTSGAQEIKSLDTNSSATSNTQTDAASESGQLSLLSRTSQQLSPRAAARKAMQFYQRSRSRSPLKKQHSASQLRPTRARVNLPALAHAHFKNKFMSSAITSSETKAVVVNSPPKDSFLRDMLKGARYSSNKVGLNKMSPTKVSSTSGPMASEDSGPGSESNKENTPAPNLSGTTFTDKSTEFEPLPISDHHGLLAGKAPSSLAASTFHASAFLPQYDGAVRAQASSLKQQHGLGASQPKAKVNLPQGSSYSEPKSPLGTRSHNIVSSSNSNQRSWSSSFGLDGSGDEPPKQDDGLRNTGNAAKGKQKEFDTRGLTEADFAQHRPDVKNMEHYQEVNKFFDDIHDQEQEYMARRLRENTKAD